MSEEKRLLEALSRLKVETGSLACLGCGHEHDCSTEGCAILRKAEVALELSQVLRCQFCDYWTPGDPRCMNGKSPYGGRTMLQAEGCEECSIDLLAESEKARSDLAKKLAAAQQRADRLLADLKATKSCTPCVHVDTTPDCDCECQGCEITCPCSSCRDSSNFKWRGDSVETVTTNGGRLRQHTDEEWVELLYQHYLLSTEQAKWEDPALAWCDLQGGCEGKETSECTPGLHKACILRWLKSAAVEGT